MHSHPTSNGGTAVKIVPDELVVLILETKRTSSTAIAYIPLTSSSPTSIMLRSGWTTLSQSCFFKPRSTMHFSARKITAATLAALLAALACFEHALHDTSHSHSSDRCCQSVKLEACPTDHCSSHGSHAHGAMDTSSEGEPPAEHDPEDCAVCCFLALPQLFEPPPHLFLSDVLVSELAVAVQPSIAERAVRLATIRGPPACERTTSA